jgi:hypothetical protein
MWLNTYTLVWKAYLSVYLPYSQRVSSQKKLTSRKTTGVSEREIESLTNSSTTLISQRQLSTTLPKMRKTVVIKTQKMINISKDQLLN